MSTSLPLIPEGFYRISNVGWPTQTADLLYPGGNTGTIGGYPNDNASKRMLWQLTYDVDGHSNHFVLANQQVATYAAALQKNINKLVGNPDVPGEWMLFPTVEEDEYIIMDSSSGLVWTLGDGHNGTPITLEKGKEPLPNNQTWKFKHVY